MTAQTEVTQFPFNLLKPSPFYDPSFQPSLTWQLVEHFYQQQKNHQTYLENQNSYNIKQNI